MCCISRVEGFDSYRTMKDFSRNNLSHLAGRLQLQHELQWREEKLERNHAALTVTVVFAAAITVPGGSNQETGTPLFSGQFTNKVDFGSLVQFCSLCFAINDRGC
ncbi:hypothetical protein QVD17_02670 [Tagetes erecta]|uniref:PGG domain-containing protein n=1 Tax=Tagetes erecta TaxID=13708 RepID=A0AAD8LD77_TARER|nr:hypothetical protein QVD17_02670 [Tagetes erecta]